MKNVTLIILCLLMMVLHGCGGAAGNIREFNSDLYTFYTAKIDATKNKDWNALELIKSSLTDIAKDASTAASKEDENANKASFYRVAVTAAWQAEITDITSISSDGENLCRQPDVAPQSPRDCAMILSFPIYAAVDDITHEYNSTLARVNSTNDRAEREMKFGEKTKDIFNRYLTTANLLLGDYSTVSKLPTSPEFQTEYEDRNNHLFTFVNNAATLVRNSHDLHKEPGKTISKDVVCKVKSLATRAMTAGLPENTIDSLTVDTLCN